MDLRITVLATGMLESASSLNVVSEVEGQVSIISLAPRGTRVKEGDVVVELDSSSLKTRRLEQQVTVEQARAAHAQAKQSLQVAESQAESDVRGAELTLHFAELDLRKFLEGDSPQELRVAQSEITLAEEELKRAKERIKKSEELEALGYLSAGQVDADRLTVLRAEVKLQQAKESERLLREFTHVRAKEERESKVDEGKRALARAKSLAESAIVQAEAKRKAQEATQQLEESKLKHIEEQIAKCTLRAPRSGLVIYPVPQDEEQTDLFIEQGKLISERRHIYSLPDSDTVQVTASIHEAMVKQVKPGRKARIWIDARPELALTGEVIAVSDVPDPQSWRRSTVKFYQATVRIDDQSQGLLPGMNAKVEVLIDERPNVLAAPVQAIIHFGDVGYCYVSRGPRPELRRLRLGKSNEKYIEIAEGLADGDQVVLSPDEIGLPAEVRAELEAPKPDSPTTRKPAIVADSTKTPPAANRSPDKDASPTKIEWKARLTGSTKAKGKTEFQIETKDGETVHEFDVKVEKGPANQTLEVTVDNIVLGTIKLDDTGFADIEWSTADQTLAADFKAGPGSVVKVGNILSGTLQLSTDGEYP